LLHIAHDPSCRAMKGSEMCRANLELHTWAISGTKGSSGLGSASREQIESSSASPNKYLLWQQSVKVILLRTFRHCQRRRPILLQNVQADTPISTNVGVVNLRREIHFRPPERVINRVNDTQVENATRIWRIALQTPKRAVRTRKGGLDPVR